MHFKLYDHYFTIFFYKIDTINTYVGLFSNENGVRVRWTRLQQSSKLALSSSSSFESLICNNIISSNCDDAFLFTTVRSPGIISTLIISYCYLFKPCIIPPICVIHVLTLLLNIYTCITNIGIPKEPLILSVSTIDNRNPLTIPKQTNSQIRGKDLECTLLYVIYSHDPLQ